MNPHESLPPEVPIAGWNAAVSFDRNRSEEHRERAFEHFGTISEGAEVVAIPEFMGRDSGEDDAYQKSILHRLADEHGFAHSITTTGVRPDGLNIALLSRRPYEMDLIDFGNERYLPFVKIPGYGEIIGVHNQSDDEKARIEVHEAIVDRATNGTGKPEDAKGTTTVGDKNATYAEDGRNARILHGTNLVTRVIPKLIEVNYHSPNKWKHLAGAAIRAGSMAEGGAMNVLTNAGFHDADPDGTPTVFYNIPVVGKLRVDHIMATPDIALSNFRVVPRTRSEGETPVSDHAAIQATGRQRMQPAVPSPNAGREHINLRTR